MKQLNQNEAIGESMLFQIGAARIDLSHFWLEIRFDTAWVTNGRQSADEFTSALRPKIDIHHIFLPQKKI